MKVMVTYARRAPYPPFGIHLAKAFRRLGCRTLLLCVRDRPWWGTAIKQMVPDPWKSRWRWNQADWANGLVLRAAARYRPDLLVEVEGDVFTVEALRELKRRWGTRLGLLLVEGPCRGPINPVLQEYGRIVSTSQVAVQQLRQAGFHRATYLPFATDPEWFRPAPAGTAHAPYAIGFVGAYAPRRAELLAPLSDMALRIWGSDWDRRCDDARVRRCVANRRGIFGRALVSCYQRSKLFLNIQREHMRTTLPDGRVIGTGLGYRHFDVPACGSCLLSEPVLELSAAFDIGREVDTFETAEELRDKSHYLLRHEAQRANMVQRARARVLREHTYLVRGRQWLAWYERGMID